MDDLICHPSKREDRQYACQIDEGREKDRSSKRDECCKVDVEVFHGGFRVDDFVHHGGGEVSLTVEMKPRQKRYDLVEHRHHDAQCEKSKEDIVECIEARKVIKTGGECR